MPRPIRANSRMAPRESVRSPISPGNISSNLRAGSTSWRCPYRGIGQGVGDLISGQILMFSANATAQILDLHRAGKVRILAVNSTTRIKAAPDIPTSIESGLPGMVAQTTFGIFALPARRGRSSTASTR